MWMLQTPAKTSVYCSPHSGQVLALFRNDVNFVQGVGSDQPTKPSWTEEQAVAASRGYFEAIFGSFPSNAGKPVAQYQSVEEYPKHYPGYWTVRWSRTDGFGDVFANDSITVGISEKYGLTGAAFNFFSSYSEPHGSLVTKEEALSIASVAAETMVAKWLGRDFKLGSPNLVEKVIINPNRMLNAKNLEEGAKISDLARLSWYVSYPVTLKGSTDKHAVQVWVDAETKSVIGGDYF
jgi:hypothetical protein